MLETFVMCIHTIANWQKEQHRNLSGRWNRRSQGQRISIRSSASGHWRRVFGILHFSTWILKSSMQCQRSVEDRQASSETQHGHVQETRLDARGCLVVLLIPSYQRRAQRWLPATPPAPWQNGERFLHGPSVDRWRPCCAKQRSRSSALWSIINFQESSCRRW